MRLGLVIYGSLDTISGGYLYDRMLVKHLRACGDEVDLISLPWRDYTPHLADNLSPAFIRRLRNSHYELLLQDELNHPSLFLFNRFLKGSRPVLSIVHHLRCSEVWPSWKMALYRAVERRYLRSVDGFIFNSRTTKAVVDSLVAGARPSTIAYPGRDQFGPPLDPERIRRRATRLGPLRLLFVGNLIPRKGLHTLLDALAQISAGWELRVVGSADFDPGYAALIQRKLTKSQPVSLLGLLNDADLAAQFAESDVIVVPSTYEGFGIVYLEGMGFGLPAIATTAGAAGEIITHGENGYLIRPDDHSALADHIQTLINDRALLLEMSLAARERQHQFPTWDQSAEQIRAFIYAARSRAPQQPITNR